MKLKFWGVRGLLPIPLQTEDIERKIIHILSASEGKDLSSPSAAREYLSSLPYSTYAPLGSNTLCVEVKRNETTIILEAGSGLRLLGQSLMGGECGRGEGTVHLFLTHPGWDHIQGFPFFIPAYKAGDSIIIYSPFPDMEKYFLEQQEDEHFPAGLYSDFMKAKKKFTFIHKDQAIKIGGIEVRVMPLSPSGPPYGYRLEDGQASLAYAPHVEGVDIQSFVEFLSGADVLLLGILSVRKREEELSLPTSALKAALRARVKKLFLFNYHPEADDELVREAQRAVKNYLVSDPAGADCEVMVAYEGMEIYAPMPRTIQIEERKEGKAIVLFLAGRLDAHTAKVLEDRLHTIISEKRASRLVLNMEGVSYLSAAGLKVLLAARVKRNGTAIALSGLPSNVRRVIKLAGCDEFFAIYPDVRAALASLEAREYLNLDGQTLGGRYFIENSMGQGRMGAVYKAFDVRLERPVAIKVLSSSFSEEMVKRFLSEARSMAQLTHPNIVAIYDCDEHEGKRFMVMEYVSGQSLRDLLRSQGEGKPLPTGTAIEISLGVLQALEYAHRRKIFHRDLCPENILIAEEVKLTDFSLARFQSGKSLLEIPMFISSPDYTSPEQILGEYVDERADLYSLGIVLYEMLTGRRPFEADSDEALMHLQVHQTPVSPRQYNPSIPRSLEYLILKLLEKNPADRYPSAIKVREVLESLEIIEGEAKASTLPSMSYYRTMVGREKEYQKLLLLLDTALTGEGRLVFICGEAGIGKTRLAQELLAHARTKGITTITGHCYDLNGALPYQPFIEALKSYISTQPQEKLRLLMSDVIGELARILPEVRDYVPNLTPNSSLEPGQEKARLFESIANFLGAIAQERPLILLLEDLHWADKATSQLLQYLSYNLTRIPILLIVTMRDAELEPDHPLHETMRGLSRQSLYTTITLPPLTPQQVKSQLEGIFQEEVDGGFAELIYRETEGNPFYVEEIVKALIDEGKVYRENERWKWARADGLRLPQTIKDVINRRLTRLSPQALNALKVAAVIGRRFNFQVLTAVMETKEDVLLDSLDEALQLRLIRDLTAEEAFIFSYGKIREVLYNEINPLRRRRLHYKIGQALETLYSQAPESVANQLAYHYYQAQEKGKAVEYLTLAGDRAMKMSADEEALDYYSQARDMLLGARR